MATRKRDRRAYMRQYQSRWRQERREAWIHENGPCAACGSSQDLEVDHVDPDEKEISTRGIWSRRADVRAKELAKCQVLCRACHQAKSLRENPPHLQRRRAVNRALSDDQARQAHELLDQGMVHREIAARLGVSLYVIRRMSAGRSYRSM